MYVHTLSVADSGFAGERKSETPLSFPQKAVTHIGFCFFLLPLANAWDLSEKKPFLLRELAVGVAASLMGTEALRSVSGSYKAEAGNELMLPVSLQLPSGSLHLAQEPGKSCGTVLGAEVPAPEK